MRRIRRPITNGHAISRNLNATLSPISRLKPLGAETRRHSSAQIHKLAASLDEFGFVLPIVADKDGNVVHGWALVRAARQLGLSKVPAVIITDLDEPRLRALRLALNRLAEYATWDDGALRLEFAEISKLDSGIDLQITGFEIGEIDVLLRDGDDEEDDLPAVEEAKPEVTTAGDIWVLDQHRVICANALDSISFKLLMHGESAQMAFTDPPYNVEIEGHVSGLGATQHREFRMASGEMSKAEFECFLATALGYATNYSADGAIHYVCMDWRHIPELLSATANLYTELKNVCVWNKSNAGMGSLYRSKHELVFVFKKGRSAHTNNIELETTCHMRDVAFRLVALPCGEARTRASNPASAARRLECPSGLHRMLQSRPCPGQTGGPGDRPHLMIIANLYQELKTSGSSPRRLPPDPVFHLMIRR